MSSSTPLVRQVPGLLEIVEPDPEAVRVFDQLSARSIVGVDLTQVPSGWQVAPSVESHFDGQLALRYCEAISRAGSPETYGRLLEEGHQDSYYYRVKPNPEGFYAFESEFGLFSKVLVSSRFYVYFGLDEYRVAAAPASLLECLVNGGPEAAVRELRREVARGEPYGDTYRLLLDMLQEGLGPDWCGGQH